jgi:hypothetical protein
VGQLLNLEHLDVSASNFKENWLTQAREIKVGKRVVWQEAKQEYTESWHETRSC